MAAARARRRAGGARRGLAGGRARARAGGRSRRRARRYRGPTCPKAPTPGPTASRGSTGTRSPPTSTPARRADCAARATSRCRAWATARRSGCSSAKAPGADEDERGEPFVGQAGRLLDSMLAALGMKPAAQRLHRERGQVPAAQQSHSRARSKPTRAVLTCERQVALLRPKLIVALGKVPATQLLGRDATIASLRGRVHATAAYRSSSRIIRPTCCATCRTRRRRGRTCARAGDRRRRRRPEAGLRPFHERRRRPRHLRAGAARPILQPRTGPTASCFGGHMLRTIAALIDRVRS